MASIWRIVTLISSALAAAATIAMVVTYRRERRIGVGSLLLSIVISAAMLLAFALASGVEANPLLASLALVVGLLVGILRALGTRLYQRNGQVVGRHSLLFLLGWGLSYALAAALNLLGSALASAAGLLALCLSTGTQIGLNGWLLVRCLTLRPGAAPPSSPPERGRQDPKGFPSP
jgi:hypothetical protein